MLKEPVTIIGAGLAGSEAAWQIAQAGCRVELWEMRPGKTTPAHRTADCAELVCSNSFGSALPDRASGQLKWEMENGGSLILATANQHAVPAGRALAVDRDLFAAAVTLQLESHPRITLIREELPEVPASGPCVIASGPLTSDALAADIARLTGSEYLYFYDALAPVVDAESIDLSIAFRASRYDDRAEGDYLNCPLNREEYNRFIDALLAAERIPLKDFEKEQASYFEGCMPVEVLAARGRDALAFGPMRPVGLDDPRTGRRPHAAVQLRQDNAAGSLYNMVGFQTNLKWGEQEQVLRLIPGLQNAEFVRLGQMHRNTFLNAPALLTPGMELRTRSGLFFAGQITGIEGYLGNAASGWLAGRNAVRRLRGTEPDAPPPDTMLGALCHYVTHADPAHFQPMKANFGLMPELHDRPSSKDARYAAYTARARASFAAWLSPNGKTP